MSNENGINVIANENETNDFTVLAIGMFVEVYDSTMEGSLMVGSWDSLNKLIANMKVAAVKAFGEEPVTQNNESFRVVYENGQPTLEPHK